MWRHDARLLRRVRTKSEVEGCTAPAAVDADVDELGVFDNGEGTVGEGDGALGVVDTDMQLASAGTAHDVCLDLLVVEDLRALDTEVTNGCDKLVKGGDADSRIHLG